ncbi:MAG: BamA/TamA family outer membrane protein, partial [Chlamydiota bacterium]|nr:BamA/TamA family outer membrane protein [Chlamydiota bacterium]
QNTGYFKSVSLYPLQRESGEEMEGKKYRDVVIEVEEGQTGNASLFFGMSSLDNIFGGLSLTENNFNAGGLTSFLKEGLGQLRGGGEYLDLRLQIGKQKRCTMNWVNPYFRDTLWTVGWDVNASKGQVQTNEYDVIQYGSGVFVSYPFMRNWTLGSKIRCNRSIMTADELKKERHIENTTGVILGWGWSATYDTILNPLLPRSGSKFSLESEVVGDWSQIPTLDVFSWVKAEALMQSYYPVTERSTFKVRCNVKFLFPFLKGKPDDIPPNERFYLGGVYSVRGYKDFNIGPKFTKKGETYPDPEAPTGGISSLLASVEYIQHIAPICDAFLFFDGGTISMKRLDIPNFRMSYGAGCQLRMGNGMPFIIGYGIPINPGKENEEKRFFLSFGGQF